MKLLERRLSVLESHKAQTTRRVHVICATDETDKDRQIAEMLATGIMVGI